MILKMNGTALRIVDWSESSQIVTVISDKYGKISGVAKGSKRLKSSFDGAFDYLNNYQLLMVRRPGQRLGTWTESYLFDRPLYLRNNLPAQYFALSCLERCRELLEEEERLPIYDALMRILHRFSLGEDPQHLHNVFTIKILSQVGYLPVTTYCVGNGRKRNLRGPTPFSSLLGGILCPVCIHLDPNVAMMGINEMNFIQSVDAGTEPEKLTSDESKALNVHLTKVIQHILGKGLRMNRFLSRIAMLLVVSCLFLACTGPRPTSVSDQVYYEKGLVELKEGIPWYTWWKTPFDDLNDYYPESSLVADSLYQLSLYEEEDNKNGNEADKAQMRDYLLTLIVDHPTFELYNEALNKLFESHKAYFLENKNEVNGRVLYDVSSSDLDMMMVIAKAADYTIMSDEALMMVADTKLGTQEFDEAESIYREILNHLDKDSPYYVEAQYKLALSLWDRAVVRIRGFMSRYLRNPSVELDYDDRTIAVRFSDRFPIESELEFKELIRRFKDSDRSKDAESILKEIDQLKHHRYFILGEFYEFYGEIESAIYYYRKVGANSDLARLSRERESQLLDSR